MKDHAQKERLIFFYYMEKIMKKLKLIHMGPKFPLFLTSNMNGIIPYWHGWKWTKNQEQD